MKNSTFKPLREILGKNTLPLGFGSGALLSRRRSRREALRLLETALDCGITYFDTARSYGSGLAEGILGELIPRSRDRIILASKAGILPGSRSILVRAMSRGTRLLHSAAPRLKDYVPVPAAALLRLGAFGLVDFQKSVETSLRELRTDYLDILLLHECTVENVQNAELLDFLQRLKKKGIIRTFGVATGIEETVKIVNRQPLLSEVVQIPNSIWDMNINFLPSDREGLTVTHSSLTSRFHALLARLSSDQSLAREWQSMTQVDPRDSTALAQLLLAHALRSNPTGVVLFFSSNPTNIKANVRLFKEQRIDAAQIEGLNELVASKFAH